jgi:hypothetical protein
MKWISKVQIIIGLWILTSPWILGFSSFSLALWSNVIGGAVVAILGLWGMFGEEE